MLKVLDLFSGVGGMSLGATQAGFTLAGAVELDSIAIDTHKINFPNTIHIHSDISKLNGEDIKNHIHIKSGELSGIIGGPPCQGFSTMGKRDSRDPRNSLFIHYFRLIKELQPDFFIAENVPGILNSKFDNIRKTAFDLVNKRYNLLPPMTISAKDVGVPTTRKRIFFIGIRKHSHLILNSTDFTINETKYNYVKEALFGLPLDVMNNKDVWTKIDTAVPNSYSEQISIINLESGIGNPGAIERFFVDHQVSGMVGTIHKPEVIERFRNVEQGRCDKISKAPKLNWEGFCPTLRAGTGSDKGSYQAVRPIHPIQPRVITPREAARIQGFPDWFQFHRTKWHSFRQIGNSVSPIVAKFILSKIYEKISK